MQKKTLNINIWEIANYSEEDCREFIREAGFDPEELYNDFGRFMEEIEKTVSKKKSKGGSACNIKWAASQKGAILIAKPGNTYLLKSKRGTEVNSKVNLENPLKKALAFNKFIIDEGVLEKN